MSKRFNSLRHRLLIQTGAALTGAGVFRTQTSVSDPILIGQSAALSGPSARLGHETRDGINAAFAQFNSAGGARQTMKPHLYKTGGAWVCWLDGTLLGFDDTFVGAYWHWVAVNAREVA